MSVEFIDIGDTAEYAMYKGLEKLFCWDYATVRHGKQGINNTARVVGITWDVIAERMKSMQLGKVGASLATNTVCTWNIPTGVQGSKIAVGTITGNALGQDAINARHIQAETIGADQIAANAITAAKIKAGQITATKIKAGAVTADKLDADTVNARFAEIATAQIGAAEIGYAKIRDGNAEHMFIKNGNADEYYIKKFKATTAQMYALMVGMFVFKGTDNNYYTLKAGTDENGNVTLGADRYYGEVTEEDKTNGVVTIGGEQKTIFEKTVNVDDLTAANAHILEAFITTLHANQLWANEAFITLLKTTVIHGTNGTLTLMADDLDKVQTVVDIGTDGVTIRDKDGGSAMKLDSGSVTIGTEGFGGYARFGNDSLRFGNYELRMSADGGLVFKMTEDNE